MINNVTYAGSSNTMVKVLPDNSVRRADDSEVLAWVADGNIITPYIEPMDDNKETKYAEIYTYADSLIETQESAFFSQGSNLSRNKERLAREQQKRNNKKISGITLTPQEELDDDKYDYFMDWADQVYDAADLAEDAVELLVSVSEVQAYDVINTPAWPIWSPPV